MMFISVPDPTISATISNNPMPAASAKDVETAGRTLRCWLAFFSDIKNSSPRRELNTNQCNENDRDGFSDIKIELFFCLLCPVVLELLPLTACCSATNDVVTLSNGTLNSLDIKLKTEANAPTAASSSEPDNIDAHQVIDRSPQSSGKFFMYSILYMNLVQPV
jgi:hypothetical protein